MRHLPYAETASDDRQEAGIDYAGFKLRIFFKRFYCKRARPAANSGWSK
jgi:hypothetical protein